MFKKIVSAAIIFTLVFEQSGFAQVAPQMGIPAYINGYIAPDRFRPVQLRSISFNEAQGEFNLYLDKGDAGFFGKQQAADAAQEFMRYFKTGLALPNDTFWVNLRPDDASRIVDPALEKTDIGRILLAADLQLKKDLARFTHPDTNEGRQYWNALYAKAEELFGHDNITIPTVTRPWIVPGEIIMRSGEGNAYIYKATLNVMLEQDHLKDSAVSFDDPRLNALNAYSSDLVRSLIIPKLVREVNSSKKYAQLRQVYYCLILAQWFKKQHPDQNTIDQRDLTGLMSQKNWSKDNFFKAYQRSFAQGEYNKEETVPGANGLTVRTYVSGGIKFDALQAVARTEANGMLVSAQQAPPVTLMKSLIQVNPQTNRIIGPASRDGGIVDGAAPDIDYLKAEKLGVVLSAIVFTAFAVPLAVGAVMTWGFTWGVVTVAAAGLGLHIFGPSFADLLTDHVVFRLLYGETRASHTKRLAQTKLVYPQDSQDQTKRDGGEIDVKKWLDAKVTIDDLNKDMFRDYDYRRTKMGPEVKPAIMFRFGLAWAKMALDKAKAAGITNRDVIVARDARKIEEDLPQALIDAFRYMGLNVKYTAATGPNAVTSYSWAIQAYRPLMSLFITASHVSDKKENQVRGFKVAMMKEQGGVVQSMSTREIKKESFEIITNLIEHPEKIKDFKAAVPGTYETVEVDADCIRFNTLIGQAAASGQSLYDLARRVNSPDIFEVLGTEEAKYSGSLPLAGVRVIVEGFNTPSGKLGYETFRNLGAEAILLHGDVIEVDGEHNADPAKDQNLAQLKEKIKSENADFGLAFDLDGDRGAIVVPERHQDGTITYTTLTPDNLIVALLDHLINTWGYKKELTGRRVAAIRDVLGTFAVNEQTSAAGGDPFQTDAGYVFLKALREKLLADNYSVPIYGERSGHCWLDITGEIENPVAVAVLFAVMAKQEQYNQNNNPRTNNPFLQVYKDKIIPYAQAPRFSAPFVPAFLKILSDEQDAQQKADWTFEAKPLNPPQRIIADGRDRIARELEKEFTAGRIFNTPAGPLAVKSFEAKQDDEDGKYRFADIHFALPDGTLAGRYVFRASANEPVFVMTYEAKVYDGRTDTAAKYQAAIGGLVMEWLQRKKYALFTREAIREVFNNDTQFDKWDLNLPLDHLNAFMQWQKIKDGGQEPETGKDQAKISLKTEIMKIISNREGLEQWRCKHAGDYEKEYMEKLFNQYLEHLKERSVEELVAGSAAHIDGLRRFVAMPVPVHRQAAASIGFEFAQECGREALAKLEGIKDKKDGGHMYGYQDPQAVGGIDFRAVSTVMQIAAVPAIPAQMVSVEDLERQWSDIQARLAKGQAPYEQLKQYAAQCCSRDDASRQKSALVDCVMNILRLEEERALATSPQMKELLCMLG